MKTLKLSKDLFRPGQPWPYIAEDVYGELILYLPLLYPPHPAANTGVHPVMDGKHSSEL